MHDLKRWKNIDQNWKMVSKYLQLTELNCCIWTPDITLTLTIFTFSHHQKGHFSLLFSSNGWMVLINPLHFVLWYSYKNKHCINLLYATYSSTWILINPECYKVLQNEGKNPLFSVSPVHMSLRKKNHI